MGSAVFAGVTMTNLPGMIVLKFATAKLIEVFFFRMGLTITLVGMVHGLIFLPVLLTYIGPRRNPALYKALKEDKERFQRKIREGEYNKKQKQSQVEHFDSMNKKMVEETSSRSIAENNDAFAE